MNQKEVFDVIYVGAGPATVFSVLQLLKTDKKLKILILEKGHLIENRDRKKDVVCGMGGSGCFSDNKLSSDLYTTGGQLLRKMTQKEYERYEDIMKGDFSKLLEEQLEWDNTVEFPLPSETGLEWLSHKTLHLGTERGMKAMFKAEQQFLKDPRVVLQTETEVTDVGISKDNRGPIFGIQTNKPNTSFLARKLVVATGQKGQLSSDLMKKLNLPTLPRFVNIGIRVKDIFHDKYQEISKANYDFKISKTYNFSNEGKPLTVRLRTFCVNSGNAHLCEEKVEEFGKKYSLFNGHAFRGGGANGTINYGIVAEIEGLGPEWTSKEAQTQKLWEINQHPNWKKDNLDENGDIKHQGRNLLEDFENTANQPFVHAEEVYCKNEALQTYPKQLLFAYSDFVYQLNKVVDLSKATYFYPEAKPAGTRPNVTEDYEIEEIPGLFLAGDCVSSRGIIKAGITGIIIAEKLIKR